jgi:hypothetical protein
MGDEWYCRIGGVEHGPLPFPELVELATSKQLSPRDELRFGSEGPWTRADSVSGLFEAETAPPPKPAPAAEPEPEFAHDLAEFQLGYDASPAQVATAGDAGPADPYAVDWYAKSLGLEFGRMTFRELVEMAARGALAPADRVRPATSNDWRPAHTVPAIQSALATASRGELPPVSATPSVSRTTVVPPAATLPSATPVTAIAAPATPVPVSPAVNEPDNDEPPTPRTESRKKRSIAAVAGAIIVCAAAGAFLLFRAPSEQSQYQQLSGLYEEMKSLRERKASDREWTLLADRIKRDVMPWVTSVSHSQPVTPAGRALMEAGRDHLLPMLGESRRRPGPHEKEFIKRLEEARTALGEKG